jgi:hypothetical protein
VLRTTSFVSIFAIILAACGDKGDGGADETTSTTGAESTSTTTSSEESTGGACGMCIAPAPDEWVGPIFVSMTGAQDPIPSCLVGEQMLEAFSGLEAPVHTCMCECGGGVCSGSLDCGMDPACADATGCGDVDPDMCVALPADTTSISFSTVNMACVGNPMPSIPEASFTSNIIGCAAATEETCPDGTLCANPSLAPFGSTPCVFNDYDTECPGPPYTEKTLLHEGFDDQRECSTCACGSAGGGQCGGAGDVLELHASEACDMPLGMLGAAGWACADSTGATHVRFVPESEGGCEITMQSEPSGEAVLTGPITLCCAP